MSETIYHEDLARIKELLLGRSATKTSDDTLELDDGTKVKVIANEGCGGCTAGWYELDHLVSVPNIITSVELVSTGETTWGEFAGRYEMFVVAEDTRISLLAVDGDDGNGYYGTGFRFRVEVPE